MMCACNPVPSTSIRHTLLAAWLITFTAHTAFFCSLVRFLHHLDLIHAIHKLSPTATRAMVSIPVVAGSVEVNREAS